LTMNLTMTVKVQVDVNGGVQVHVHVQVNPLCQGSCRLSWLASDRGGENETLE
jgi:hypothetical protein